jgi:hypothetical protein
MRNYYFQATDEQMTKILDALREAGAQIERVE